MLKACPMTAWLSQLPTYNLQAYNPHKRATMVKFIKCKKVSVPSRSYNKKKLIWKIDKSIMNILGIAKC
jgi:hypothetical protein